MNGEKRDMVVEADTVENESGVIVFRKDGKIVAGTPADRLLYFRKVDES